MVHYSSIERPFELDLEEGHTPTSKRVGSSALRAVAATVLGAMAVIAGVAFVSGATGPTLAATQPVSTRMGASPPSSLRVKVARYAPSDAEKGSQGDYQVPVVIGGKTIYTTIDTGSSTLAFPGRGATSHWTSNGEQEEGQVTPFYPNTGLNLNKTVTNLYASGGWSGDVYEDNMVLDGMHVPNMQFVSITKNVKSGGAYFWDSQAAAEGKATGIMGLAYKELASENPTTMSQLLAKGYPNSFSLRLCHAAAGTKNNAGGVGELAFGEVKDLYNGFPASDFASIKVQDQTLPTPSPMNWYYDVKMTGFGFDSNEYGKNIFATNISGPGISISPTESDWSSGEFTIFDSGWGNAGALMPSVYDNIKLMFSQVYKLTGDEFENLCFVPEGDLQSLPNLVFQFEAVDGGTTTLLVRPSVYLSSIPAGCNKGNYAFNFDRAGGEGSNHVMGNQVMAQYFVIFDRTHNPARLLLADPITISDNVCSCVRGIYHGPAVGCSCYPGWRGSRCDEQEK